MAVKPLSSERAALETRDRRKKEHIALIIIQTAKRDTDINQYYGCSAVYSAILILLGKSERSLTVISVFVHDDDDDDHVYIHV